MTRSRGCTDRGFTLMEMLVVMVLIGLLGTLTLPSMQRWHDAMQSRAQAGGLVDSLRGARFAASARRRELRMDAQSFAPPASAASTADGTEADNRVALALPPGWSVRRVVPASFHANGLCSPGMAVLATDRSQDLVLRVDGPVCGVQTLSLQHETTP